MYDIVRALRAVGENRLASEIEIKYMHHLSPLTSVAPQANTASLATSLLTSSLQSSLPASQCDTSPLATLSVNQYYQSDLIEINALQPPSSVPQQERAVSYTHTLVPTTQHMYCHYLNSHCTLIQHRHILYYHMLPIHHLQINPSLISQGSHTHSCLIYGYPAVCS